MIGLRSCLKIFPNRSVIPSRIIYSPKNILRSNEYSGKKHYSVATGFANNNLNYKEGLDIEGFTVSRVCKIPEFSLTAVELVHKKTGAEHLHLSRDDSNNAFSVGFRTTPFDSTGVPHILEHLCTCGSEKYPCRDPYFKMLSRSMATFMNAMTGPDFTIYPFSTQNHSDYMNLMSVYMDAVFRPVLRKSDFLQEAWRLEHRDVDDPKSPIVFKGVVLNEMKGVFSDNQNIFYESLMNNLLPSHTYGFVSGGDPLHIPDLTYEFLKEFHRKHYHPSNSKFYSYGNFPLKETLQFINHKYLDKYHKEDQYAEQTYVPPEPKWESEKRVDITCQLDKMTNREKQSSIAIGHLCTDVCDIYESFVMNIVTELLVSGPNSPLYKALVEPNIGSGFSPVTGFMNQTRSTYFSVGLQGLNSDDFDWFIETFNSSIKQVIESGFDERNIEGVLHNIELSVKHQTADFGLAMLFAINTPWIHNADVVECMKVNEHVDRFRKDLKEKPRLLQDYVAKYLKDNLHRLVLTMTPDNEYGKKINEQEKNVLNSKLNVLSESEKNSLYGQGLLLRETQSKVEDISCLPTLKISDLSKNTEKDELTDIITSGVPLQLCCPPTNGLTYFNGLLGIENLSNEAKKLVPVFCYIADKMGTSNTDYRKFDQEVLLRTKGLSFSYHNSESLKCVNEFKENILISSQCLDRNSEHMFKLWTDLFNNLNGKVFENKERFQTLMSTLASNYLNSIPQNGHHYAMIASSSLVSASAMSKEICGGLTMVKKLQNISQPESIEKTLEVVKDIAKSVLNKQNFRAALNVSPDGKDEVLENFASFCESVGGSSEKYGIKTENDVMYGQNGIHHIIPMQVNFSSKSMLTVPYEDKDFPALRVLCRLLTLKYLIPEVREKGGAYGAGVNISSGGVLSFYSYRDPNPVNTFNVFDKTQEWVFKNKFTSQDLEEAKLGTFQSVDAPVPPSNKGMQKFLAGLEHETFEKHRLALMNLTEDDLYRVATKYLDIENSAGRVLIGPENGEVVRREGELWNIML